MAIVKQRSYGKETLIKKAPSPHAELCAVAASWLRRSVKCNVAVHEVVAWCNERPDAIGWNTYKSTLVEVKLSRADFKRDAKKWHFRSPEKGMGNYRYYLCPEGLLGETDMPANYGLLHLLPTGRIKIIKKATRQEANLNAERTLLASIVRRSLENCEYMKERLNEPTN